VKLLYLFTMLLLFQEKCLANPSLFESNWDCKQEISDESNIIFEARYKLTFDLTKSRAFTSGYIKFMDLKSKLTSKASVESSYEIKKNSGVTQYKLTKLKSKTVEIKDPLNFFTLEYIEFVDNSKESGIYTRHTSRCRF
jgi:hypothetical protein